MHFHLYNILCRVLPAKPFSLRRVLMRWSGMKIGKRVAISTNVMVYNRFLMIGDDTWVGPDSTFYTNQDGQVSIGRNCDIGPGVALVTGSHEMGDELRRAGTGYCRDISIGDGSWIGARAVILGGVVIGLGSVVGAGALVLPGNYAANSLLIGVPAKVKKTLGRP
jgi:maltose O-acetyltransferase